MNNFVVEGLEKAKEYISKGWCQNVYSRNARGDATPTYSEDACQWCSTGAMLRVVSEAGSNPGGPTIHLYREMVKYLRAVLDDDPKKVDPYETYVPTWNDHKERTQEEVLAAFDRAIALAKKDANVCVTCKKEKRYNKYPSMITIEDEILLVHNGLCLTKLIEDKKLQPMTFTLYTVSE